MEKLVIEYHYNDGDIGAYDDAQDQKALNALWEGFSKGSATRHAPQCIIIRPAQAKEEGYEDATNENRAVWADTAIQAFERRTGMDRNTEGEETVVTDLLADLMHYCNQNDIHFRDCIESAERHFEAELSAERHFEAELIDEAEEEE